MKNGQNNSIYGSILASSPTNNNLDLDSTGDATPIHTNVHSKYYKLCPQEEGVCNMGVWNYMWNKLVFGWLNPLLQRGNQADQLDFDDLALLPLPKDCRTTHVCHQFDAAWEKEVQRIESLTASMEQSTTSDRKRQTKLQPSLIRALMHAYGLDFLRAGILKLIHDCCIFVGPQVLNGLIMFLRDENSKWSTGYWLTLAVTCSQLTMSFCLRHYFFRCYIAGLKIRTAIIQTVYRKTLNLSSVERQNRTTGEITNLVSVDAQRLQDLTTYLHAIWYSFLQIGLAIHFLWGQLGPSCLGGVAVIITMMPITKKVAQWMGRKQRDLMKARDERTEKNAEILSTMKVIKFQSWEESFQEQLTLLRNMELKKLLHYVLASSVSINFWNGVPLMVALATFATYTLAGHDLDVASALTALALFDILRFPMNMLPTVINRIVEAGVSVERVHDFLCAEEYKEVGEGNLVDVGVEISNGTFVHDNGRNMLEEEMMGEPMNKKDKEKRKKVQNEEHFKELLDTKWESTLLKAQLADAEEEIRKLLRQRDQNYGAAASAPLQQESGLDSANSDGFGLDFSKGEVDVKLNDCDEEEKNEEAKQMDLSASSLLTLRRIQFECQRGEFVVVIGAVGSGKSSFINSILGEVRSLSGSLSVKGKLAVFPQTPFIMNNTLRNNILFGHARGGEGDDLCIDGDDNDENYGDNEEGKLLGGRENTDKFVDEIDEDRYQMSIDACALRHDLSLLSHGDQTEIGERGITLSGGQKARVALARALYHDAEIYLLDDPLAAVDAHVGKHIFQRCIIDELLLGKSKKSLVNDYEGTAKKGGRNAAVILVTNALQYLNHPLIDKIIVLKDGCVEESGTYAELSQNKSSLFSSYLSVMLETGSCSTPDLDSNEAKILEGQYDAADSDCKDDGHGETTNNSTIDSLNTKHEMKDPEQKSASSSATVAKSPTKAPNNNTDGGSGTLTTDEMREREVGSVGLSIYLAWVKAAGGWWVALIIVLLYASVEGTNVLSKWWLTHWSQHGGETASQMQFLAIYAIINMVAICITFFRIFTVMLSGLSASSKLFTRVLDAVLQAPMSFFDITPTGRIVNRFSKDMYTIDEQLVQSLRSYLACISAVLGVVVVVSSVTPSFAFCLIPILIFYVMQQNYFTKTYRELKRIDSVSRSPIYALLGETLDGVYTIRAFSAQDTLINNMVSMLDKQQQAYYLTCTSQCWLGVRLELAGTLIISFACICAVVQHGARRGDEAFAGLAGLSISFALSVTQSLNWSVRMSSDLEANMVAVERIEQYCKLPREAPRHIEGDENLSQAWPTNGAIEFRSVEMRYRPGLPLVLKGLTLNIPARSKVGIVGRTGAGKSTLMVALMRIVELNSGSIFIDGVDISKIGLKLLRSEIAIIPQDPVLFAGSVRSNLDPFGEYSDERLYEVLSRVGLTSIERVPSTGSFSSTNSGPRSRGIKSIDDEVTEGGSNFSVGQRQLLVIARALLCGSRIVIMDEATAAVDADTDAKIQRVMSKDFQDATCLTVAHRINTIMDSDHILVMDDGRAAEFDTPSNLLTKGGMFKDLVEAWDKEQEH